MSEEIAYYKKSARDWQQKAMDSEAKLTATQAMAKELAEAAKNIKLVYEGKLAIVGGLAKLREALSKWAEFEKGEL